MASTAAATAGVSAATAAVVGSTAAGVVTGATISVGSGMALRAISTSGDPNTNALDVFNSASDPRAIVRDAVIGGVSGGIGGATSGVLTNALTSNVASPLLRSTLTFGQRLGVNTLTGFAGGTAYNYTSALYDTGDFGYAAQRAFNPRTMAITMGLSFGGALLAEGTQYAYRLIRNRFFPNSGCLTSSTGNGGVLDNANYAQTDYSQRFSAEGRRIYSNAAGTPINTVDDLAAALQQGTVRPSDVPIDYIIRDGNTLIVNTRSSQALIQAGIPRNQWTVVNRTSDLLYENMLTAQLARNNLTSQGTPTVSPNGG